MLLNSCSTDYGVWGSSVMYSSPGYNSSVSWTDASFDVNGFPIYGYSYGRPVYGYTASGTAIYSLAALTSLCYVPDWSPAPWYNGAHRHPHHCHHAPAPPKYDHGHRPGRRPAGGLNAQVHKTPSSVVGKPINHLDKLGHNPNKRPATPLPHIHAVNHRPAVTRPSDFSLSRPGMSRPIGNAGGRPSIGGGVRPGGGSRR